MKKIILSIAVSCFAFMGFSQITLFKEIEGRSLIAPVNTAIPNYWYVFTGENVVVYNHDFDILKTIKTPNNATGVYQLFKGVYTTSGKYEFICPIFDNTTAKYYLYNEDGVMLYDFGEFSPWGIKGNKLITYKLTSSGGITQCTHRIYELGGSFTSIEDVSLDKMSAFPNPASDFINIEYSIDKQENLQIYDINGRLIDIKQLDISNKSVQLQTSNYVPGIYVWIIGKNNGKFIVE